MVVSGHLRRSIAERLSYGGTIGALMIAFLLAQAFTRLRSNHARQEERPAPRSSSVRRAFAHPWSRGRFFNVYLAPLSIEDGRPVIGRPLNITDRAGYDGEPAFTADGRAILFTSAEQ